MDEGRFLSALQTFAVGQPGNVMRSMRARALLIRLVGDLAMTKVARRMLSSFALDHPVEYAVDMQLRWQEGKPLLEPPAVENVDGDEIRAAYETCHILENIDEFDFETWIAESAVDRRSNPKPYYAMIALANAGVEASQVGDFAIKLLLTGYCEARFVVAASTILLQSGSARRAERIVGLGLKSWPSHGSLWLMRARIMAAQGNQLAAAEAAIKSSNEVSLSQIAREQLGFIFRSGMVWSWLSTAVRHAHRTATNAIIIGRLAAAGERSGRAARMKGDIPN